MKSISFFFGDSTKELTLCLVLCVLAGNGCQNNSENISADMSTIWDTRYEIIRSRTALPNSMLKGLDELFGIDSTMANPNEMFNPTDVITEKNSGLPNQRLIFGGISDRDGFILYEQGGYQYSCILVMFSKLDGNYAPQWRTALPQPVHGVNELKELWANSTVIELSDLPRFENADERNAFFSTRQVILKSPITFVDSKR